MKKITRFLVFAVALLLGTLFTTQTVKAANLEYDFSGIWFERWNASGSRHTSWKLENYEIDGQIAYCIEPDTDEGMPLYLGNWSATGFSASTVERIQLVAYYGYTYPGHQTQKYRAATQAMLWEAALGSGSHVQYSSERYSEGTAYDVSSERAEIERLIANHYKKPSFNGHVSTAQVGETIKLTDTNGVLSNYNVSVSGANYSISGNTLSITPTKDGSITLSMSKKQPYSSPFKLFIGDGVQNMVVPGTIDPVTAAVRVNAYYGAVEMTKQDEETGIAQGQATLEGAKYGVYEKGSNNLVTTITTNSNGYAKSGNVLKYGTYYLKEMEPSEGYYLDENRYEFDSKAKALVTMNVTEKVVKNHISILKQYDYIDGNTAIINAEQNITFDIYYPDGRLYDSITTDKNGYATIDMPYGVWTFHQVNTTENFEKIYDFIVTVNYESELSQYYNILNNKLNAYLQVVKKDKETGKTIALANTTFKILNTDTNECVTQFVGGKVYSEFTTDEEGKFITYLKLVAGNYRLIEISEPKGYLLDTEGLDFKIGNDTHYYYSTYGAFVVVEFEDAPIKGQIEIYKLGEKVLIENGTFIYDSKELEGVKFNIYAAEDIYSSDGNHIYYHEGDLVETVETDEVGYAISMKLPLGKYIIVEEETVQGYVLDTERHEITLTEIDNKTPVVYESISKLNYLKKGKLEFTKTDLTTGKGVPLTKIEIYTEADELIFTGMTDKDGKIIIDNLFVGKFKILETEPATGYRLSNEVVYFEITEDGEIIKANMTNEKVRSTIRIHKTDENNNPLEGVTIGIYDLKGNLIHKAKTDKDGNIEVELEYGSYYFQEIETIDGYDLNEEKVYFDVTKDGELIQKTLVNETTKIEVPNTDKNRSYIVEIGCALIFTVGLGVLIYANKKRKK